MGRPKRQDPTASASTQETPHVAKRRRKTTKPASQPNSVITSKQNDSVAVRDTPEYHDGYERPARNFSKESDAHQSYFRNQAPECGDLGPPHIEWLGWPSVMTDHWCDKMFPAAATGRIITESESPPDIPVGDQMDFSMDWHPARTAHDVVLPTMVDQAIFQGSLAWIDPGTWITPDPIPNTGAVWKKQRKDLPFGIGRRPAYYVHENMFSSDPRDAIPGDIRIESINGSSAMVRLLSIVYGLRLRSTLVQNYKSRMNLGLLIHRHGPLFIGTYSLSEYVMTSAQELELLVAVLLSKLESTCRPDEQLSACLLSTVVDVYCRILSFFELFLEHLTDGAERFASDPVIPIPGMMFDGVVLREASTQGTLFSSAIYHILGRLENVLGLDPVCGYGLLSSDQLDELCNRLDRSNDLAQGRGIMRPADMKNLFAQVSTVLEQLSLNDL